nr:retrovirus-related Pol polyprotein from transposon TNT 1-94 [Tanacetum cinerariifolium]
APFGGMTQGGRLQDSTCTKIHQRVQGSNKKKAINEEMVSLEKNQTYSLVRLLAENKASQSLWMFRVEEEHDYSKRYKARLVVKVDDMLVVGSDMAEFNKPKWELPLVFEMNDRCFEKQVLGYVLTVGVTTVEREELIWLKNSLKKLDRAQAESVQYCDRYTKSSIHLVKNLKFYSWANLVQKLISKGSLSLLKILGTKSLAEMFISLPWGVQFGTGGAFWHDRAVWHESEQFSSELNNISLV